MRVLITGARGFVGSNAVKHYQEMMADIVLWGRENTSVYGLSVSGVDLFDYQSVLKSLSAAKPDIIIHCAGSANVGRSIEDPIKDLNDNYITVHNILFAMKQLGLLNCRFVFLSSAAVYGNPTALPISETAPLHPLSPYALHKLSAEECCRFAAENYGIDVKILRVFSAYGPGLKKQIFWDMYRKVVETEKLELYGTGNESRDYIYIDDLIQAIHLIAHVAPKEELTYNVGNGKEIRIREVAEIFASHLNLDEERIRFNGVVREGDPLNWCADIQKLAGLGYRQAMDLDKGISVYISWADKQYKKDISSVSNRP